MNLNNSKVFENEECSALIFAQYNQYEMEKPPLSLREGQIIENEEDNSNDLSIESLEDV